MTAKLIREIVRKITKISGCQRQETVQNSRKKDEKVCYEGGVHTKRTEDDGTNVEYILQIIVSPTQKLKERERTAQNRL